MYRKSFLVIVGVLLALGARDASAQVGPDWTDRGYLNLNVAFESTSGTLNDATTFPIYGESGSRSVQQATDSGALFDMSVGTRVWRNVSVGIGFHREATTGGALAQATVPHPLFFNASRAASATASELDRSERAFHLQLGYMLPITDRLNLHITAGPSFFKLTQEVISGVTFAEGAFPFSTLTTTAEVASRSDSATGGHIGVDASYQVYESDAYKVGAGMFVRWTGATAKIMVLDNVVDSDLGGVQIGFGARVRF